MSNYAGNDNYGRPKSQYLEKIAAMTDEQLRNECSSIIYMSEFCSNNPRADWHWMVDALYDESKKRGGSIYDDAYDALVQEHS